MKIKTIIMAAIAFMMATVCQGQNNKSSNNQSNMSKSIVVPFTTHEGSGLASCVSDVKKAFPKANVTGQFSIYGHEVRSGKAKVEKWIKSVVKN